MGYIECSGCEHVLDCEYVGKDNCINFEPMKKEDKKHEKGT